MGRRSFVGSYKALEEYDTRYTANDVHMSHQLTRRDMHSQSQGGSELCCNLSSNTHPRQFRSEIPLPQDVALNGRDVCQCINYQITDGSGNSRRRAGSIPSVEARFLTFWGLSPFSVMSFQSPQSTPKVIADIEPTYSMSEESIAFPTKGCFYVCTCAHKWLTIVSRGVSNARSRKRHFVIRSCLFTDPSDVNAVIPRVRSCNKAGSASGLFGRAAIERSIENEFLVIESPMMAFLLVFWSEICSMINQMLKS